MGKQPRKDRNLTAERRLKRDVKIADLFFLEGIGRRELARRFGLSINTITKITARMSDVKYIGDGVGGVNAKAAKERI
jgi:transposase